MVLTMNPKGKLRCKKSTLMSVGEMERERERAIDKVSQIKRVFSKKIKGFKWSQFNI